MSSDFFTSFLNIHLSLSINCLTNLNCELYASSVAESVWRFVFLLSSIPLLESMCVRDLVVATDLSVL